MYAFLPRFARPLSWSSITWFHALREFRIGFVSCNRVHDFTLLHMCTRMFVPDVCRLSLPGDHCEAVRGRTTAESSEASSRESACSPKTSNDRLILTCTRHESQVRTSIGALIDACSSVATGEHVQLTPSGLGGTRLVDSVTRPRRKRNEN